MKTESNDPAVDVTINNLLKGESVVKISTRNLMLRAWETKTLIPAFNIPYIPIMSPVVRALEDTGTFGLIDVAQLEWEEFEAKSLRAICEEYEKLKNERYTRLHLDHVPVVDGDGQRLDFESVIAEAIDLGYESVMIDASRLELEENISTTARVVEMANKVGVAVEAELGMVLGHGDRHLSSYEEFFSAGNGFTDPEQAKRFVKESGVDWLGVAIGNIHGATSGTAKSQKKFNARLNIEHLERIRSAVDVPLVLHGGSGVQKEYLLQAVQRGIAKINIGTVIRQAYESLCEESIEKAQDKVYNVAIQVITNELEVAGSAAALTAGISDTSAINTQKDLDNTAASGVGQTEG